MVFHVGINFMQEKAIAYIDTTKKSILIDISDSTDLASNLEDGDDTERGLHEAFKKSVDSILDKIVTEVNDTPGCAFIYIDYILSNLLCKKFIETGKEYGFTKIEFIDELSMLYIDSLVNSEYLSKVDDLIWMLWKGQCYIWKVIGDKSKIVKTIPYLICTTKKDLRNLQQKSGMAKNPNIIIYDFTCQVHGIENVFPESKCHSLPYFKKSEHYGVFIKAMIMAGMDNGLVFDTSHHLDTDITVNINERYCMSFNSGVELPFEKTVIVPTKRGENILTILAQSALPFRLHEQIEVTLGMFLAGEFLFTFMIDENNICSTKISTNIAIIKDESRMTANKIILKKQGYFVTFPISNEEADVEIYVLRKPFYISFTEEKPIIGEAAIKILKENPTFVVYDLIKLCSITDPFEADPKWSYAIKMDDENKILVEFNTSNGRRKSTPAFLMALIFRDIVSCCKKLVATKFAGFPDFSSKKTAPNFVKFQIHFHEMEKNETLISTINEAARLVKMEITFP